MSIKTVSHAPFKQQQQRYQKHTHTYTSRYFLFYIIILKQAFLGYFVEHCCAVDTDAHVSHYYLNIDGSI